MVPRVTRRVTRRLVVLQTPCVQCVQGSSSQTILSKFLELPKKNEDGCSRFVRLSCLPCRARGWRHTRTLRGGVGHPPVPPTHGARVPGGTPGQHPGEPKAKESYLILVASADVRAVVSQLSPYCMYSLNHSSVKPDPAQGLSTENHTQIVLLTTNRSTRVPRSPISRDRKS